MNRLLVAVLALVVAAPVAVGTARQAPGGQAGLTFDVVSVKRSAPQAGPFFGGGTFYKGNRWTGTNVTLRSLVRSAYDPTKYVAPDQIVGGPDWMDSERFDLVGVANGTPTRSEFQEMVRAFLADRFQLTVHTEMRELPALALVPARADRKSGPSLAAVAFDCAAHRAAFERRELPPGGVPQFGTVPACSTLQSSGPSGMRLAGRAVELSQLARLLTQALGRVVVDRTGLQGLYDFDLQYTPDSTLQAVGRDISSGEAPVLPTALAEQLGLKVESVRAPVEVLVIDHAERPREN